VPLNHLRNRVSMCAVKCMQPFHTDVKQVSVDLRLSREQDDWS